MAGHHLLNQAREKRELITVEGKFYNVHLTYYHSPGIDGYVVGLKFSDQFNSMDPSKRGSANPFSLGIAVADAAVRMITPDLDKISIFGFYLLTEDLETRRKGGAIFKKRLYNAQALKMHMKVKHYLPHIVHLEAEGGFGWAMSREDFKTLNDFKIFERELEKRLEVLSC